jgi:tetratricopeptide (TPR) repeat protein
MSEITEIPQSTPAQPKRRTFLFAVIAIVILLALLYFGGNFVLPALIKSDYDARNCGPALSLNNFYISTYPSAMMDKSITALVNECALYSLATANEEKKAWQDAYNAYKTYTETYPAGLFVKEAHQHSPMALIAWAKELQAQKKYEEAVANLNLVAKNYGDTSAAIQAADLMPEVYTTWSAGLRNSSDFAGSENILMEFKTWAESVNKVEAIKTAHHELAETYLAWGLAFQAKKQFEDAKAKFDLAVATDPQSLADSGPAARAKAAQLKLYSVWGDDFLEQGNFQQAIDRYSTFVVLSEISAQPLAKESIVNAYLKWAASLSASEDFLGALQQVEQAQKNAADDAAKKSIDSATSDTYTAFSKSSGSQAQKAMKDAARKVCEQKKKPDLPIFGLDKDNIRAVTYGISDALPDNVAAKTPGAMHYVACIETVVQSVETRTFYWAKLVREKYTWNVILRLAASGETSVIHSVDGGTPPPLPDITFSNYLDILRGGSFQRYRGANPDVVDLANWLLTAMR